MNIATLFAQLKAERDQLDRAITALEHVNRASPPRPAGALDESNVGRVFRQILRP